MNEPDPHALQSVLASFIVPQTGRALGGSGTPFELTKAGAGWHVAIQCGFPMARSRVGLIEALSLHCEAGGSFGPIEFTVTSVIVSHAVQHGLKPLPGVRN